ncbi:hypothetical protein [Rhodanobacter lindaniclasticus]
MAPGAEPVASFTLIGCLLAFIGSRLFFAVWWPLHPLDFVISSAAVVLLVGSFSGSPRIVAVGAWR